MKTSSLLQFINPNMLLEDRIDYLRTNFAEEMLDTFVNRQPRAQQEAARKMFSPESFFKNVVDADPSPQKKFTQWLINLFLKNLIKTEDFYKATGYLNLFMTNLRNLPQNKRDINAYKSLEELRATVEPFANQEALSNRQKNKGIDAEMHQDDQITLVYNSPTMKVVIPKTEKAACYFGQNTEWCTAATSSNNMFSQYDDEGPLYIILIKKENKRFQFHFETSQFTDEHDLNIEVDDFIREYPEIKKVFSKEQLSNMHSIPELYYDARNNISEYLETRIRKAFAKPNGTSLGVYNERENSFTIVRYPSIDEILRDWFSDDSDVAKIINGDYFEDFYPDYMEHDDVSVMYDSMTPVMTQALFKEMVARYKSDGYKLDDDDKETIRDIMKDKPVDSFLLYFEENLDYTPAEELRATVPQAMNRGAVSGVHKQAHEAATEHLKNLEDHMDSTSVEIDTKEITMQEDGNNYRLVIGAGAVVNLAHELETGMEDISNGWRHHFTVDDVEAPYYGWDNYDEEDAVSYWKELTSELGWKFLST